MEFTFNDEPITVFTISPRTLNVEAYWRNIELCIAWSNAYRATGLLLFEGNDTFISVWTAAQATFANSDRLSPLVAVNPVYMHPFSVAKLVNSYAQIYRRKTYLNMITGTALSHLDALNDALTHDQRYARLAEYAQLIWALLSTDGAVTFAGDYYKVNALKLDPPTPRELLPEFFFAGGSDAATAVARLVNGTQMRMLAPSLEDGVVPGETGVHFGIVTRPTPSAAREAAERCFPEDKRGERVQALSMKNTDSVWKQRMAKAAKMEEGARPGYWLRPFKCFQADCPYFIGSHDEVAELLAQLVRRGIRHIVLDIPCQETEFANVDAAFTAARQLLAASAHPRVS
jgi:alkanesulfonate monooxygenase